MPAFTEPQPSSTVSRAEIGAWAVLLAILVGSRFAVAPHELFEWDSANYALSLTDYDVSEHRPHAPGYPLFALLLRLAASLMPVWAAFVAVNALLGGVTLAALGSMLRPSVGPRGAWLLAFAFAACPLFWLHGAASTAYVAEGMCAVTTGALGLAVLRGRLRIEVAAVGWALCLGLRPNGALTLSPLMAWVAVSHARAHGPTAVLRALAVGAVTCLGWALPMVAESGGLRSYLDATAALSEWQFKAGSAFVDGPSVAWRNAASLLTYALDALNFGVLALLAALFTRNLQRPSPATLGFFAAWLLPSSAYYVLHHLPKSGYALTVVPGLAVALVLASARLPRVAAGTAVVYALANSTLFFLATPYEAWFYEDAPELVPERIAVFGDYSATGLRYRTRPLRKLDALLDEADPKRDAVLFLSGAHELHRLAMATHGEFDLTATFAERGWSWSTRDAETYGQWQRRVLLAPRIRSTDYSPSDIAWDGHTLALSRRGADVSRELEAERLLVVVPCAPCILGNAGPAEATERVDLGAGFTATWLQAP
ncbi:MAG: hypothetical protein EP330_13410 [Deltaproteobacteria bacterium]|nr:MAG: hypothetical protein EP330_13410 [Deltaproteobacteria bacterium]